MIDELEKIYLAINFQCFVNFVRKRRDKISLPLILIYYKSPQECRGVASLSPKNIIRGSPPPMLLRTSCKKSEKTTHDYYLDYDHQKHNFRV